MVFATQVCPRASGVYRVFLNHDSMKKLCAERRDVASYVKNFTFCFAVMSVVAASLVVTQHLYYVRAYGREWIEWIMRRLDRDEVH